MPGLAMAMKEVIVFAASLVAASSAALAAADADNFASIPKYPCSVHKVLYGPPFSCELCGILFDSSLTCDEFVLQGSGSRSESESSAKMVSSESGRRKAVEDPFAPRFDGLRFIETLVTAHR